MKKRNRWLPLIVLIILALVAYRKGWFGSNGPSAASYVINRNEKVVYTRHARCRMGCRHITDREVREIIAGGKIDRRKSDPSDKPCPTYALEGYSHENQHLRIVVATCGDELKIITCIDLDKDWPCDCN